MADTEKDFLTYLLLSKILHLTKISFNTKDEWNQDIFTWKRIKDSTLVKTKQILKVVLQADEKCYQRKERESMDKTALFLMFAKHTAT